MTIDELLKIAQENIGYARLTNTMDQAERGICAAIAQAAAATAQAMILHERGTIKIERIGQYVSAVVGIAPTGELLDN